MFFHPKQYREILRRGALETLTHISEVNEDNADKETVQYWIIQVADVFMLMGDCLMQGVDLLTEAEYAELKAQGDRLRAIYAI